MPGATDYVHYHSSIHEVLGIARGSGKVIVTLKAGDAAILPAGTGHQCLKASGNFLVVGAYPHTGRYDECTWIEDRKKALTSILKTAPPRRDPIFGKDGPLVRAWHKVNHARK